MIHALWVGVQYSTVQYSSVKIRFIIKHLLEIFCSYYFVLLSFILCLLFIPYYRILSQNSILSSKLSVIALSLRGIAQAIRTRFPAGCRCEACRRHPKQSLSELLLLHSQQMELRYFTSKDSKKKVIHVEKEICSIVLRGLRELRGEIALVRTLGV